MSIELSRRVKELESALVEVNRQIAEFRAAQEDHVVNCTKVMDLVKDTEKRKPGRPPNPPKNV